jgi:hypothetical protein
MLGVCCARSRDARQTGFPRFFYRRNRGKLQAGIRQRRTADIEKKSAGSGRFPSCLLV